MPIVLVPTPLRRLTGGQSKVTVAGTTIDEVVAALEAEYPGFAERLVGEDGEVKRFINIFVNEDEMRTLQGVNTPISEGDRISIVPAMAGGGAQRGHAILWNVEEDR